MGTTRDEKVRHVKNAKQTRDHDCHWPGCGQQVPPAKWGCYKHWMMLPRHLRERIWNAYAPGQERTQRPSREYVEAARAVQEWIAANHPATASGSPRIPSDDPKAEAGDFSRGPARCCPGWQFGGRHDKHCSKAPPITSSPARVATAAADGDVRTSLHQLGLHFAKRKTEVIPLTNMVLEEWAERAAIREHVGGLPRRKAELYALEDTVELFNARFASK